jgi:hypothetical protein
MEPIVQVMAQERQLGPGSGWALLVALLAGAAFGFVGFRASGKWVFAAAGGALFTFVIALLLSSLGDADALPYTDQVRHHRQTVGFVLAIVVAAIVLLVTALRARIFGRLPQPDALRS